MDISRGFQISAPAIFVPWLADEAEITRLLAGSGIKKVTTGYYTLECEPLVGLRCLLGFHLHATGKFTELEFFRRSYDDLKGSFGDFQRHFESAFGEPTYKVDGSFEYPAEVGSIGFPRSEWKLSGARIVHYIFDRFGPEEHMRIQKI
jgi:hypothetical protein